MLVGSNLKGALVTGRKLWAVKATHSTVGSPTRVPKVGTSRHGTASPASGRPETGKFGSPTTKVLPLALALSPAGTWLAAGVRHKRAVPLPSHYGSPPVTSSVPLLGKVPPHCRGPGGASPGLDENARGGVSLSQLSSLPPPVTTPRIQPELPTSPSFPTPPFLLFCCHDFLILVSPIDATLTCDTVAPPGGGSSRIGIMVVLVSYPGPASWNKALDQRPISVPEAATENPHFCRTDSGGRLSDRKASVLPPVRADWVPGRWRTTRTRTLAANGRPLRTSHHSPDPAVLESFRFQPRRASLSRRLSRS